MLNQACLDRPKCPKITALIFGIDAISFEALSAMCFAAAELFFRLVLLGPLDDFTQKKPHQSGASRLIRDCLLGVSNTPILKRWMDISSDCFTACVVVLVTVGELNALLG